MAKRKFLFTSCLAIALTLASIPGCDLGLQKTRSDNNDGGKSKLISDSVINLLDTIISKNHLVLSFIPISDTRHADNFLLYISWNEHYDSMRKYYYGWDDTSRNARMFITVKDAGLKKTNLYITTDSILLIALPYNLSGTQLISAVIGNGSIKFQKRHLENEGDFIVFSSEHLIGAPIIRGINQGNIYLYKYDNPDTFLFSSVLKGEYKEIGEYTNSDINHLKEQVKYNLSK